MPTGFPFQAPPKKFFSGKQKFFRKLLATGGGGRRYFSKTKVPEIFRKTEISKIFSEEILHFLKMLQFQHASAPSPQVGPPFFTFLPPPPHTPPPQVARPCFSLDTGIYVDDWKRARVIPIYKSEDRRKCENYRPISILPIVSKVFERDVF